MGALYFGDNLHVLREEIRDERIDLIYLAPPFNSKRDDNVFLKTPKDECQKTQLITIKKLLAGRKLPEHTDISSGTYNFKKAKKEGKKAKREVSKGF